MQIDGRTTKIQILFQTHQYFVLLQLKINYFIHVQRVKQLIKTRTQIIVIIFGNRQIKETQNYNKNSDSIPARSSLN
jgi:hypothetical protein